MVAAKIGSERTVSAMLGSFAEVRVRLRDAFEALPDACDGDSAMHAGDIDVFWSLASGNDSTPLDRLCTIKRSRGSCVGQVPRTSGVAGVAFDVVLRAGADGVLAARSHRGWSTSAPAWKNQRNIYKTMDTKCLQISHGVLGADARVSRGNRRRGQILLS